MTAPLRTAREIIEALQEVDPDTPVIVSTHYDNGIGYASQIGVALGWVQPMERAFWDQYDPEELKQWGDPQPDDGIQAVVITAWG